MPMLMLAWYYTAVMTGCSPASPLSRSFKMSNSFLRPPYVPGLSIRLPILLLPSFSSSRCTFRFAVPDHQQTLIVRSRECWVSQVDGIYALTPFSSTLAVVGKSGTQPKVVGLTVRVSGDDPPVEQPTQKGSTTYLAMAIGTTWFRLQVHAAIQPMEPVGPRPRTSKQGSSPPPLFRAHTVMER